MAVSSVGKMDVVDISCVVLTDMHVLLSLY